MMGRVPAEISWKGRFIKVPAVNVDGLTVIIQGKWVKIANVKDEIWLPGDVVGDPETIVARLKREKSGADLFHFYQKTPGVEPRYKFPFDRHNVAAIPITSFADWWGELSRQSKQNIKRSEREGVVVRQVPLDDELIAGIVKINNESPVRQGRRFWHYGKSFEAVKKDYSDLLDHSEFLGAYYQGELIGLMRLMCLGDFASVLQLLCLHAYCDKRPASLLISKAVEHCAEKGAKYLVYGQYVYGDNTDSTLTEFKRRAGFKRFDIPSYWVPLTLKGRLAKALNVHESFKNIVPRWVLDFARSMRSRISRKREQAVPAADSA